MLAQSVNKNNPKNDQELKEDEQKESSFKLDLNNNNNNQAGLINAAALLAAAASANANSLSNQDPNLQLINPFFIQQIQQVLSNIKQNSMDSSQPTLSSCSSTSSTNTDQSKDSYVSKIKPNRHLRHKNINYNTHRIKLDENRSGSSISYSPSSSSSSSPSSVSSDSSQSSPSQSPQPLNNSQFNFNDKNTFTKQSNYSLSNQSLLLAHQKPNSSNSSLTQTLTNQSTKNLNVQSSSSNTSVSNEVKLKLKNCILQKLKGSNTNISTVNNNRSTQVPKPEIVLKNNDQFKAKLEPNQQHQIKAIIDENSLRRTTSEPNLKVKSALKDRLLEKRNLLNPFMANKRPKLNNHLPSPLVYQKNTSSSLDQNQMQKDAILAAVAAATAAAVAAVSQSQSNLISPLNIQNLITKNYSDLKIPNSISYPTLLHSSINKNNKLTEPGTAIPKFGNMVHVEEENELLLENELKQNEQEVNKSLYYSQNGDDLDIDEAQQEEPINVDDDDTNYSNSNPRLLSKANSYQNYQQYLQNLNSYYYQQQLQQQQQFERMQKFSNTKTSYFSDPYLLKSFEIASIGSTINLNKAPKTKIIPDNENTCLLNKPKQFTPTECNLVQSEEDVKKYKFTTGLVYDYLMEKHECTCMNSENHLETPDRIKSIWSRLKLANLDQECELVPSKLATISDLLICHNEQYSLIFGSDSEQRSKLPNEYLQTYISNVCLAPCRGLSLSFDQDNSWNEEFTSLACRVAVGSTYHMASLVSSGKLKNGFAIVRPPGSHAEYNKPLGFCYFNTVAIVAKLLKKNLSLERILIVDWDVHHGNGTQQMTYNDPNIMYISLHRHDMGNFFPGTGTAEECGEGLGIGKNVNIPWNGVLNPPMCDVEYLAAFRSVVMPIAKAFKPQIVLVSCGFDATEQHPKELGGFKVSPTCFAYMTKKLMSLADGKVVLALEGGYDLKSLCDSSELCVNALMGKQIPSFPNSTLDALPNSSAVADLKNVIQIQKKYWPDVKEYSKYVNMSHNQFISVYTE